MIHRTKVDGFLLLPMLRNGGTQQGERIQKQQLDVEDLNRAIRRIELISLAPRNANQRPTEFN